MDLTTFVSIDTETTGLDFLKDRVIQFGCAVFIKGQEVMQNNMYIQCDIPNGGYEINQITDEQIQNGEPSGSAFATIAMIINKTLGNMYPRILTYNAPFDLGMITNEFRRHGIVYDLRKTHVLDPLVMWRHFHPFKKGKLENVSSYYEIPNVKAHDAGSDAACAGHVYLKMLERYGILRNPYLTDMQKGWHEKWKQGMLEWAKGQDKEIQIEPWPVRPEWVSFARQSETLY